MKIVEKRLKFSGARFPRVTHYLFRYPAKFHPPVAATLLDRFSNPGDTILDPFCGSGTLAVEARLAGRHVIGTDIDPVAVFVSKVKTRCIDHAQLQRSWSLLSKDLAGIRRSDREYDRRQFIDITAATARSSIRKDNLWIPRIPNIHHWFRNYVLVDLARLLVAINAQSIPAAHKDLFRLCFASVLRNASNADPVPVSGLEVTAHMIRKDKSGRIINPFALFDIAVTKTISAMADFSSLTRGYKQTSCTFYRSDATAVARIVKQGVSTVITSPPYHAAVDYYRRHTLEMYWLDFTTTHQDRLDLLPQYIGRATVPQGHPFVMDGMQLPPTVKRWERRVRRVSDSRANALKHYSVAMRGVFQQISQLLDGGRNAIFVVGKSKWGTFRIPTDALFAELAGEWFEHVESYWYPIKNRYMSYSRHNGASIDREHVLVLKRR